MYSIYKSTFIIRFFILLVFLIFLITKRHYVEYNFSILVYLLFCW